jgi:hypothetical protein
MCNRPSQYGKYWGSSFSQVAWSSRLTTFPFLPEGPVEGPPQGNLLSSLILLETYN